MAKRIKIQRQTDSVSEQLDISASEALRAMNLRPEDWKPVFAAKKLGPGGYVRFTFEERVPT